MRIAAIQMHSDRDPDKNRHVARTLIHRAVSEGAEVVSLPESFSWLGPDSEKAAHSEPIPGPTSHFLMDLAEERSIVVHGGSFFETGPAPGWCYNTTLFVRPDRSVAATYRKIHLFDAEVADRSYHESETVLAGNSVVAVDEQETCYGFSICYDLRFPELYRMLSLRGAHVLFIPAAFTAATGTAHWETLVRARAIENQAYVVAAAQSGTGSRGRRYFGHSMIVDPWGTVLARAGDDEQAVVLAEINLQTLREIRLRLPALQHRRLTVDFPSVG